MAHSEPGWELYRTFLAVMRGGSLSAAARDLGLTQPTVGRQVEALETALETRLFLRTPRGLSPTETAISLLPYAETLASTSAALRRAAADVGDRVAGTVRITASEVVAVEVLPPILAALRERHPELAIELVPSNRLEDLLRRESDIAVRMVRPAQGSLVTRRLGEVPLGLFAHRDYLQRHGVPVDPAALRGHSLIGFYRENAFTRTVSERFPWLARERFALRTDSDLAGLAALRAGFGIGVCQLGLARRDDNLVRVLADDFQLSLEVWLTLHEDLRHRPRCRTAFAALAEGLGRYLDNDEPAQGALSEYDEP